jgi:hypothetical protein
LVPSLCFLIGNEKRDRLMAIPNFIRKLFTFEMMSEIIFTFSCTFQEHTIAICICQGFFIVKYQLLDKRTGS